MSDQLMVNINSLQDILAVSVVVDQKKIGVDFVGNQKKNFN